MDIFGIFKDCVAVCSFCGKKEDSDINAFIRSCDKCGKNICYECRASSAVMSWFFCKPCAESTFGYFSKYNWSYSWDEEAPYTYAIKNRLASYLGDEKRYLNQEGQIFLEKVKPLFEILDKVDDAHKNQANIYKTAILLLKAYGVYRNTNTVLDEEAIREINSSFYDSYKTLFNHEIKIPPVKTIDDAIKKIEPLVFVHIVDTFTPTYARNAINVYSKAENPFEVIGKQQVLDILKGKSVIVKVKKDINKDYKKLQELGITEEGFKQYLFEGIVKEVKG